MNAESLRQQAIAIEQAKGLIERNGKKLGLREGEARYLVTKLEDAGDTIQAIRTDDLDVPEVDF